MTGFMDYDWIYGFKSYSHMCVCVCMCFFSQVHFEDINHANDKVAVVQELRSELLDWVATQPKGPVSAHAGCGINLKV